MIPVELNCSLECGRCWKLLKHLYEFRQVWQMGNWLLAGMYGGAFFCLFFLLIEREPSGEKKQNTQNPKTYTLKKPKPNPNKQNHKKTPNNDNKMLYLMALGVTLENMDWAVAIGTSCAIFPCLICMKVWQDHELFTHGFLTCGLWNLDHEFSK